MKRSLIFALLSVASLSYAEPQSSDPQPDKAAAESIVQSKLLKPLTERDQLRAEFSRARPSPVVRRVRVQEAGPFKDKEGARFMTFAIDSAHGYRAKSKTGVPEGEWGRDSHTGCVYPDSGDIYIKVGDSYRGASLLLGKNTPVAAAHICRSVEAPLAALTPSKPVMPRK
jgi:hypothetical protein